MTGVDEAKPMPGGREMIMGKIGKADTAGAQASKTKQSGGASSGAAAAELKKQHPETGRGPHHTSSANVRHQPVSSSMYKSK